MDAPFEVLREQGKSELLEILDSLRGRKCLVLDPGLQRLLAEIVFEGDQQIMKDNNVYQYDIHTPNLEEAFETDLGRDPPDNICYLVRPNLLTMKTVARHIRGCLKAGKRDNNELIVITIMMITVCVVFCNLLLS